MKINKLFKYCIIIILIILIIIGIYYLYNYVKKLNEGFQQFIIDDLDTFNQNIYNNEPRLINNNENLKVIKINKNDITTNNIINVTTKDFKVYFNSSGEEKELTNHNMFPEDIITKEHILICILKPNFSNLEEGEEIDIECKASISNGKEREFKQI